MFDDMKEVVQCKSCGRLEYYGQFRWLNGYSMCRHCYRTAYERSTGKIYKWDDLDGPFPKEEK